MAKTAISILQELMVQRKEPPPDYNFEANLSINDIGTPFKCSVKAGNITAYGTGSSKKEAKQNSAQEALNKLGQNVYQTQKVFDLDNLKAKTPVNTFIPNVSKPTPFVNYVGQLNELVSNLSHPLKYVEGYPDANGLFKIECEFSDVTTEGYGMTKKKAKQEAAQAMLKRLKNKNGFPMTTNIKKASDIDSENMELIKLKNSLALKFIDLNLGDKQLKTNKQDKQDSDKVIGAVRKTNDLTLKEMVLKLDNLGYKYSVSVYQKQPLIMMLQLDENTNNKFTMMSMGESSEDACATLFRNTLDLLTSGVKFTFEELQ